MEKCPHELRGNYHRLRMPAAYYQKHPWKSDTFIHQNTRWPQTEKWNFPSYSCFHDFLSKVQLFEDNLFLCIIIAKSPKLHISHDPRSRPEKDNLFVQGSQLYPTYDKHHKISHECPQQWQQAPRPSWDLALFSRFPSIICIFISLIPCQISYFHQAVKIVLLITNLASFDPQYWQQGLYIIKFKRKSWLILTWFIWKQLILRKLFIWRQRHVFDYSITIWVWQNVIHIL